MSQQRRWYCSCRGKPLELNVVEIVEDEPVEPVCQRCGASPSSDPRRTVTYKDVEKWED